MITQYETETELHETIIELYGTKMYLLVWDSKGGLFETKRYFYKTESNLYVSKTVFCGTKIELYRTRID